MRKSLANLAKHGLRFEQAAEWDWESAITTPDTRFEYGEARFITYAKRAGRLHVLVWTPREEGVRPISFRKPNMRERRFYEENAE